MNNSAPFRQNPALILCSNSDVFSYPQINVWKSRLDQCCWRIWWSLPGQDERLRTSGGPEALLPWEEGSSPQCLRGQHRPRLRHARSPALMKIYVCVSDCGVGMVSMGVRKGEVFLSSMKDGFSPAPENFPIRINIETKRGLQTCFFFFNF